MEELFADPDPERAERAMKAMLGMRKLDIAALRAAADGCCDHLSHRAGARWEDPARELRVLWRVAVVQVAAVAVLSIVLGLLLPHSFFESFGWLTGPLVWLYLRLGHGEGRRATRRAGPGPGGAGRDPQRSLRPPRAALGRRCDRDRALRLALRAAAAAPGLGLDLTQVELDR